MVAGEQNRRDLDAAKDRRPGERGVVQSAGPKGFAGQRFRADNPGQKADRRVDHRQRRQFTAGQDEVAHAVLLHRVERREPVVDPLIMAADDDHAVQVSGESLRGLLTKGWTAGRGHGNDATLACRCLAENSIENAGQRLDAHDHPGPAAVRFVIGALVGMQRIEHVMVANTDAARFDRPSDDRESDERRENFGKERQDVDREHSGVFDFGRLQALFRPPTPWQRMLRLLAHGRYAEALEGLNAIAATEPRSGDRRAELENKRGVALAGLRRTDDARAAFEEALRAVDGYPPALVNLGNVHLERGEIDEAIALYERALRSDEEYPPAHHNLGVAYRRMGRLGDSVRELRKAVRLEGRIRRKQSKRQ